MIPEKAQSGLPLPCRPISKVDPRVYDIAAVLELLSIRVPSKYMYIPEVLWTATK